MKLSRRTVLKGAGAGLGTAFAASIFPQVSKADDEIVIASLFDQSGGLDIYGTPMTMTCELAVEEINAAGGLNGKMIRLISMRNMPRKRRSRKKSISYMAPSPARRARSSGQFSGNTKPCCGTASSMKAAFAISTISSAALAPCSG